MHINDETGHGHEQLHEEGAVHTHDHDHQHVHADGTVHTHGHDHQHVHADGTVHTHSHEHQHVHADGTVHTHSHDHAHSHAEEAPANMTQLKAVLKYMVEHNEHHAEELADLLSALPKEPAAKLRKAIGSFEAANVELKMVLDSLE